jgi:predicted metal-binding protein
VVQGLFQGHLSHVTTCHSCKQPSEGSKREVEFYELSLQVQLMPSLHDSLVRHTTRASSVTCLYCGRDLSPGYQCLPLANCCRQGFAVLVALLRTSV